MPLGFPRFEVQLHDHHDCYLQSTSLFGGGLICLDRKLATKCQRHRCCSSHSPTSVLLHQHPQSKQATTQRLPVRRRSSRAESCQFRPSTSCHSSFCPVFTPTSTASTVNIHKGSHQRDIAAVLCLCSLLVIPYFEDRLFVPIFDLSQR